MNTQRRSSSSRGRFRRTQSQQQTRSGTAQSATQPEPMAHVPPGSLFVLAAFGIAIGIGSNVWQGFTTFAAFLHLFVDGPVYRALGPAGPRTALPVLLIVCLLIAVSFQLSILYLVFRIERSWKE